MHSISYAWKFQVWAGPLSGNRLVVALWNRCSEAVTITAKWETLGLDSTTSVSIRDLWKVSMIGEPTNVWFYGCAEHT